MIHPISNGYAFLVFTQQGLKPAVFKIPVNTKNPIFKIKNRNHNRNLSFQFQVLVFRD